MKKFLVAVLGFAVVSANAQTVDEVIQKYAAAMGGLDSFNKVKTAKFTATLISQGQVLPMVQQVINGKAMRTDIKVKEQSVINVYNNGKGWIQNPYTAANTPTEATEAELVSLKLNANLANNLMDYKNRKHIVELLGQELVDGVNAYKIKLTSNDDGKVTTYFINLTDHMLIKSLSKQEVAGNEYDAESFYSDFKDVQGLKFCGHFVKKIMGRPYQDVKYEKIELNVPVDQKIFEMPK